MSNQSLQELIQSLVSNGQELIAFKHVQDIANQIPLIETREQLIELLNENEIRWKAVVELLECTLDRFNFTVVIGNDNITLQNINDSNVQVQVIKLPAYKSIPKNINNITLINSPQDCIGRDEDLKKLHELLASNNGVLIRGIGGIGKTTLAQAYISKHQDSYQHIVWITQGEDLVNSIASDKHLSDNLNVFFEAEEDFNTRFIQIMQALRNIQGKRNNLMVIDGANKQVAQKDIFEHLPKAPNWNLIVTSQHQLPDLSEFNLGALQKSDAHRLFRSYYSEGDDDTLQEFLEEINYHTLAIEIMAKTLERSNGLLSIPEFLTILQERNLDDPRLKEPIWTRYAGEERDIFFPLSKAFKIARLSKEEIWLLQQYAVLPTIPIKVKDLAEWVQKDPVQLNKITNALYDKGWINKQGEGMIIHKIVQDVLKYKNNPGIGELELLLNSMINKMKTENQGNIKTDNLPWLPHAENLGNHFLVSKFFSEKVNTLWNNLAIVLSDFGGYKSAQKFLEAGIVYEKNEAAAAIMRSNLATVFVELGDFDKAKKLLDTALKVLKKEIFKDHHRISRVRTNLAMVYNELGHYVEAKDLMEQELSFIVKKGKKDPYVIAIRKANLASIYAGLNEFKKAELLLNEALDLTTLHLQPNHPSIAIQKSNLARILIELKEFEAAKLLLEEALLSDIDTFGPNHQKISIPQAILATLYTELGDFTKAKGLLEHALEIDRNYYFEDHPIIAIHKSYLAVVYYHENDASSAQQLIQEALESLRKKLPENHLDVRRVMVIAEKINTAIQ